MPNWHSSNAAFSVQAGMFLESRIGGLANYGSTLFNFRPAIFKCTLRSPTASLIICPKLSCTVTFVVLRFESCHSTRWQSRGMWSLSALILLIYVQILVGNFRVGENTHMLSVLFLRWRTLYPELLKLSTEAQKLQVSQYIPRDDMWRACIQFNSFLASYKEVSSPFIYDECLAYSADFHPKSIFNSAHIRLAAWRSFSWTGPSHKSNSSPYNTFSPLPYYYSRVISNTENFFYLALPTKRLVSKSPIHATV